MREDFNIEDKFRSAFDNYREEPVGGSWGRIEKALENEEAEEINKFGSLFQNYLLTPSANVWTNILKILEISLPASGSLLSRWLNYRFFGTSLIAVLTGISVIVASFIPSYMVQHKKSATAGSQVALSTQKSQPNPLQHSGNVKQLSSNNAAISSQTETSSMNSAPANYYTLQPVKTDKIPTNNGNPGTNNNNSQTVSQANINIPVTLPVKSLTDPMRYGVPVVSGNDIRYFDRGKEGLKPEFLSSLRIRRFYHHRDSLYSDWYRKYNRLNNYNAYAGIFIMPKYATNAVITDNATYNYPLEKFSEYETPNPGYKVGLCYGHYINNFVIESGINYELRRTISNYGFLYTRYDTTFENGNITVTQKNMKYSAKSDNVHQILEIPLNVGYRFNYKKSSVIPKTGVIASFDIRKQFTLDPNSDVYLDHFPYPEENPIQWSYSMTVEYNYRLLDQLTVFTSGTFRYPLNSIYRNYPIEKTFYSWGFNLGVYYNFCKE